MKVSGPSGAGATRAGTPARAAGAGFSVPQTGAAPAASSAAPANAASGIAGLSALMALQGVETATERRRRAFRRGAGLLDRLDDLKLALLAGESGQATLERLSRDLREDMPDDLDAGLAGVLQQIDLRAQVELAKAEGRSPR
ncbi:flagellar assembly regulator FliX [Brevundimonas sp. Leaf363]|uniref:flagellar assembly protein FliX n=1 Tax=Brevundimonas sp. Leaf363 TaxID=1736353 RepID=UPI0006FC65BB|nr:flagellar assembly protein FliX [Brevundimonas sp. Leaf363]KQS56154.1 flagellar assembly regulator FliX [Brevundimonas sp. Leaf363]